MVKRVDGGAHRSGGLHHKLMSSRAGGSSLDTQIYDESIRRSLMWLTPPDLASASLLARDDPGQAVLDPVEIASLEAEPMVRYIADTPGGSAKQPEVGGGYEDGQAEAVASKSGLSGDDSWLIRAMSVLRMLTDGIVGHGRHAFDIIRQVALNGVYLGRKGCSEGASESSQGYRRWLRWRWWPVGGVILGITARQWQAERPIETELSVNEGVGYGYVVDDSWKLGCGEDHGALIVSVRGMKTAFALTVDTVWAVVARDVEL